MYEHKLDRVLFEQDIIAREDIPMTVTFRAHLVRHPEIHVINIAAGPRHPRNNEQSRITSTRRQRVTREFTCWCCVLVYAHRLLALLLSIVACFLCLANAIAQEPQFRTDDGADKKLPWFKFVDGQFPSEGSAHYSQGDLIRMDHQERQFVIRVDRNDSQNRRDWDLPLPLDMLPYGSIYYNGASAALCDISLGSHLHTWCYLKDESDERPPLAVFYDRISPEAEFRRCIRVEDDFSFSMKQQPLWRIDSVDLVKRDSQPRCYRTESR